MNRRRGTKLSNGKRTTLLLLGIAQFVIAIVLFPLSLLFGVFSMLIVPPLLIWIVVLGVRLQRPTATVRAHLRRTHLIVLPVALLCIAYGMYALFAAQRSAQSGGGLLGTFGLLPMGAGLVAGVLSVVSLRFSVSTSEDSQVDPA
jgi:hypothetical protein